MEAFRIEIALGFVVVYMVFCVVVGMWAMRRTHDASDFFVAGRHLGPMVVALAVFSSTLSGFGFVGGPGLVYSTGMSSMWMVIIAAFGYAIGFFLVGKRIRMIAGVRNALSLPDVVAARYDSEWARGLTAVTILLGVMGYLATQILAMALVLQSLLAATEAFAGVSLVTCVALSLAVLVFYSVTGGIVASVYTDVVQGAIMMMAGVLILFTASSVFEGGLGEATQVIFQDDGEAAMPFGTLGMIAAIGWGFVFGVGLAGQPHLITKMMMNRRISDNRVIFPMSVLGYALAALLWFSVGIIMRATVLDGSMPPLDSPDAAAPVFLATFAHPLLAGVVFAALFAAIMSTSDAFLNIGTAAIIHDLPNAIRGRSVGNELFWARVVTLLITLVAAAFALYSYYGNDRLVALLGAFGWGTFAAAIVPVVVFGLNWKRATARAAIVAIVTSLVLNFGVEIFSVSLPFGISGPFLAIVTSMTLFLLVSFLDQKPELADDIDRILDL
jgi:SSS family transporter